MTRTTSAAARPSCASSVPPANWARWTSTSRATTPRWTAPRRWRRRWPRPGLSSYATLDAGSWRLRVTGAGDSTDIRLDVPSITLADKKYTSLVLTAGSGGMLVHASVLVQQQTGLVTARNTQARIRVVAGVESKGSVGVSWNGSTLAGSLRSPAVAPYALVDAGEHALELRVNGSVVSTGSATLAAGADYSLLAFGDSAAARLSLISDDNRLPSSTSRAKLRLIHGASLADALTLSVNYAALISDLALGTASAFATPATATDARCGRQFAVVCRFAVHRHRGRPGKPGRVHALRAGRQQHAHRRAAQGPLAFRRRSAAPSPTRAWPAAQRSRPACWSPRPSAASAFGKLDGHRHAVDHRHAQALLQLRCQRAAMPAQPSTMAPLRSRASASREAASMRATVVFAAAFQVQHGDVGCRGCRGSCARSRSAAPAARR